MLYDLNSETLFIRATNFMVGIPNPVIIIDELKKDYPNLKNMKNLEFLSIILKSLKQLKIIKTILFLPDIYLFL